MKGIISGHDRILKISRVALSDDKEDEEGKEGEEGEGDTEEVQKRKEDHENEEILKKYRAHSCCIVSWAKGKFQISHDLLNQFAN